MSWRFKWQRVTSEAPLQKHPPPRYSDVDAILYVLTLCAVGTFVSFASELPLEQVLGINFVTGWFSLDLVWSPKNSFVRFVQSSDYIAFAAGISLASLLWWTAYENSFFLYGNAVAALALGVYWILTEDVSARAKPFTRGCLRVIALYGGVTVLALWVCWQRNIDFKVKEWYVAFVLNALATQKRSPQLWTRFAHGYTWGTLIYELGKGSLIFSRFFY